MRKTRLKKLLRKLKKLESSKNRMNFDSAKKITRNGVYIVYEGKKLLYIGSTSKDNHRRMGDLDGHFSNHTLHKKFLKKALKTKESFRSKIEIYQKKRICSEKRLGEIDQKIKGRIRKFSFNFLELRGREIKKFEHFAIGILNPDYND